MECNASTKHHGGREAGSPDDEVEVGEGQHENADEGGDGAVEDGLEHLLQTTLDAGGAVTQTRQKTLPEGREIG